MNNDLTPDSGMPFTDLQPQVLIPASYTYNGKSVAFLSGICSEILHSRSKNCGPIYTRAISGPNAEFGDVDDDRKSRIDLTLAYISSRSYEFNPTVVPKDMMLRPEVCQAIVLSNPSRYIDLDETMRCDPDVIMTLMEQSLICDIISASVLSLVPRVCGGIKEIITPIVNIAFDNRNSSTFTFVRIWRHFFGSPLTKSAAHVLVQNLDWFEPLVFLALTIIGHSNDWECFECTVNMFVTDELGLFSAAAKAFSKIRYKLLLKIICVYHRFPFDRALNLCEGDVPFICYIAKLCPEKIGTCANFIDSDYETFCKVIEGGFNNDEDIVEIKALIGPLHMTGVSYKRNNNIGDFVDVIVELNRNEKSAVYFHRWANHGNMFHFLDMFASKSSSSMGDFRTQFKGRTSTHKFNLFSPFDMLPNVWMKDTAFIKRLLYDVDPQIVVKIVHNFLSREGFTSEPVGINEEKFIDIRTSSNIIEGTPTALLPSIYEASKETFKWVDDPAMIVAFECPEFPYIKAMHRLLHVRPKESAIIFAMAMVRYSDEIETCKSIIEENAMEIEGTVLLSIIPKNVLTEIVKDREFLKSIFKNFTGIGIRLPMEFRYDEEFVKMTIEFHPQFMHGYNPECILRSNNIVEFALSKEKTAAWMFRNLPETERENPRVVRKLMLNELLSINVRRSIFKSGVPEIVKAQRWCKKISTELFGTVFGNDDTEIDDPVISKLLKIAHDNHSSKEVNRGSNNAYLRSLYIDIQKVFMPQKMKESLKIQSPNTLGVKTYMETELNRYMNEASRLEVLKHSELLAREAYINELADAASSIVTPRRRDGGYPTSYFSENFEGVSVKYSQSDDGSMQLTTMSEKRVIKLPKHWQEELDKIPSHFSGFWGKLHAGYGQQQKAMMLKNGTIGHCREYESDAKKEATAAVWEGVSIKVYGTYNSHDGIGQSTIFPVNSPHYPSFVEMVSPQCWCFGSSGEADVVKLHRESVAKGGLGVVFRDPNRPLKMISLDACGYSTYVEKIVNFLTQYPLRVLSAYTNKFDQFEDEENEDTDSDKANFATVVDEVIKNLLESSTKKRKQQSKSNGAKKKQAVCAEPNGSSSAQPIEANTSMSYWSDDDDDNESDGTVSEVSSDDDVPNVSSDDDADVSDSE